MTYKNHLQLFFHPGAFLTTESPINRPNAPIGLTYVGPNQPLSTTLRFFLQFLRASLQALPQSSTRVPSLLSLVSNGWDTALSVAESERRLAIEGLTDSRIVSDERLSISSFVLLPKIRTKVRVAFDILVAVGGDGDALMLSETVEVGVKIVYGEKMNEEKLGKTVEGAVGGGVEGWEGAVRDLRERMMAGGRKGLRR